MKLNKTWLKYVLFISISFLILTVTIINYIQFENIKIQIIKENKEHLAEILEKKLDDKEQILSLIGTNVRGLYESSESVTSDEYEQYMKGIFSRIPEIKNIFILDGDIIIESYPNKNFKNFNFHDIFTTIPIKIDDQNAATVAFPVNQNLTMVIALPFEYLNIEKIIPNTNFKLIVYAQNRTITIIEIEKDMDGIKAQNIEFTKEQLDNSVHVKKNTSLFTFKTQQPIDLEYILWYEPPTMSFTYFENEELIVGISLSVLIPFLLFRAEKFNNNLKKKSIELMKLNENIETSNKILTKTQKLLLKSEEQFRNLYNLSPYAMIVVDRNGIINSYNSKFEELFQCSSDGWVGKPYLVLFSDKRKERAQEYFNELQKTGELKDKSDWLMKKDGTEFPVLFSCASTMDSSAKNNGYLSIILDQTEAHRTKETENKYNELLKDRLDIMKSIDRQKEEFASMISHELKTPLFPIKFHAKMLKDPEFGELNEKQTKSIDEIYHNAELLERLISDLLDAQKIDLGTMKFKFSEIQLDKFMENIYEEHKIYMQEKNILFTNTVSSEHIIKSDLDRIKQVFSNLIKNSTDFVNNNDGKIEIGATRENNSVLFYVKDNGVGITLEKQKNLFKRFYQLDTAITRKHGGTGLGLSICKGIVEGLGGKIWIESIPQKGTTVFFSISNNVN